MRDSDMKKCSRRVLSIVLLLSLVANVVFVASVSKAKMKKYVLYVGSRMKLYVTNYNGKIRWYSKNKRIAKISKSGIVTAKSVGKTVVYGKYGRKKVKCRVVVKKRKSYESNNSNYGSYSSYSSSGSGNSGYSSGSSSSANSGSSSSGRNDISASNSNTGTAEQTTISLLKLKPYSVSGGSRDDYLFAREYNIKDGQRKNQSEALRAYIEKKACSEYDVVEFSETYRLEKKYKIFNATLAVYTGSEFDADEDCIASIYIYADGKLLVNESYMNRNYKDKKIQLDVSGVRDLKIEMYGDGNMGLYGISALLCNPTLIK